MLRLVLPLLVPSWRFFDTIGSAPRIEIAWLASPTAAPVWRPLHPRPARVGLATPLRRLVWNPDGNAALYLTSRAERLLESTTDAAIDDFLARVRAAALARPARPSDAGWLQVRIVSTTREGTRIIDDVTFLSTPLDLGAVAELPRP